MFDTRAAQTQEGFKPNVDNNIREAKISTGEMGLVVLWWFFGIITLLLWIWPLVYYFSKKNYFNRKMQSIQESSSTIQIAERKRFATITKMATVVQKYAEHEKTTLTEVARLRSGLNALANEQDPVVLNAGLNDIWRGMKIQFERYPELKADRMYLNLMAEIDQCEEEIYGASRIYNQRVSTFNSEIYTFPSVWVASKMQLHNLAFVQASAQERVDVDLNAIMK